jgi:hypothetical protein
VAQLEARKAAAVEAEDYDAAKVHLNPQPLKCFNPEP